MLRYQKVYGLFTLLCLVNNKGISLPDISFTAVELSTQSQPVYHFVCTTDLQFYGCTVEFLLNGRTSDDMRFADNTCYNKDGQCSPHACSCSGTCKQFEWNLTSISNLDYITFGCFARIEEDQLVFKANISLMQNLGVFKVTQKNVAVISGQVPFQESSTSTDKKDFTTTRSNDNDILIVPTFVVTVCIAIMLVVFIVCCIVFNIKITKPNGSSEAKITTEKEDIYIMPSITAKPNGASEARNTTEKEDIHITPKKIHDTSDIVHYGRLDTLTDKGSSTTSLYVSQRKKQAKPNGASEAKNTTEKKDIYITPSITEKIPDTQHILHSGRYDTLTDKGSSTTSLSVPQQKKQVRIKRAKTFAVGTTDMKTHFKKPQLNRRSSGKNTRTTVDQHQLEEFYEPSDLRFSNENINTKVDQQQRKECPFFQGENDKEKNQMQQLPKNIVNFDQDKSNTLKLEDLPSQLNYRGRRETLSSESTGISSQEPLLDKY